MKRKSYKQETERLENAIEKVVDRLTHLYDNNSKYDIEVEMKLEADKLFHVLHGSTYEEAQNEVEE